MGLIRPDANETDLLQNIFADAAFLTGDPCSLELYLSYVDDDLNTGILSDPVSYETNIFFEENPSVRTLKSLSWYSEDEEILPSIVYMPVKVGDIKIQIREGSKVVISIGTFKKEYKISSIKAPYNSVIFYTCKLVPWFDKSVRNVEDIEFDSVTNDSKYSFFDVPK